MQTLIISKTQEYAEQFLYNHYMCETQLIFNIVRIWQYRKPSMFTDHVTNKIKRKISQTNWKSDINKQVTHHARRVGFIGQLHLAERDRLLHPVCSEIRRLGVNVNAVGDWWFRFAPRNPLTVHVFPSVIVDLYKGQLYFTDRSFQGQNYQKLVQYAKCIKVTSRILIVCYYIGLQTRYEMDIILRKCDWKFFLDRQYFTKSFIRKTLDPYIDNTFKKNKYINYIKLNIKNIIWKITVVLNCWIFNDDFHKQHNLQD